MYSAKLYIWHANLIIIIIPIMPILIKKILNEYLVQIDNEAEKYREKKYVIIYKLLSRMIMKLEIPAKTVMPPTRTLAHSLKVSRSTILRVYDILLLDELIISNPGSGYIVKSRESVLPLKTEFKANIYPSLSKIGKSFIQIGSKPISSSQQETAFSPGLPPLDIFPVKQWKKLSDMYWKEIKFSNLAYSPSSGISRLKENISNYLNLSRNLHCEPSQVIIVSGSLQSLYLLGTIFLNPADKIALEDPTFPNVKAIFTGLLANIEAAPLDEEGMMVSHLEQNKVKPQLIHVTPSCQYPMGQQMSMKRREELLNFASKNKSLIIENDYEHELNNSSNAMPTIYTLDKEQRTIYLGTFNRILHPSIRIGYMVVPKHFINPIEIMLKHSHRFVAPSIQYVLNQFIEKKYLQNHIINLIETVAEREVFFKQSFQTIFNNMGLEILPQKMLGLQSLITIQEKSFDEKRIITTLTQNNISVHSLQACSFGTPNYKGLIIGHSSVSKAVVKNKLVRMRQILENLN